MSDHGLLTTVGYKLGRDKPAFYALEVQDLHLNLISSFGDVRLELLTAGDMFFLSPSLPVRAPWPSLELWFAGCRTIWESSDRLRSSVRVDGRFILVLFKALVWSCQL